MGNALQLLYFNNRNIRVIDIDGEPWFPAKDVCDMLGLGSPTTTVKNACVDEEFQHVVKSSLKSVQVSFPNRGMLCVDESGLNVLVFTSRKPEARAFRKWVTSVVLPSIRKNGGYIKDQETVATGEMTKAELDVAEFTLVCRLKYQNLFD